MALGSFQWHTSKAVNIESVAEWERVERWKRGGYARRAQRGWNMKKKKKKVVVAVVPGRGALSRR